MDVEYSYIDGDLPSKVVCDYKVRVTNEDGEMKILAAISNVLSGGTLIPENIARDAKELSFDFQFDSKSKEGLRTLSSNANSSDSAYSIEEVKNNFQDYINEEKEPIQEEDSNGLFIPLRAGRFAYFSSNQKANMRTYQDNFYNSFNSSYANFTNISGEIVPIMFHKY